MGEREFPSESEPGTTPKGNPCSVPDGPPAYENWRAFRLGVPMKSGWEVALASDGRGGTGQATGEQLRGPFEILNTIAQYVPVLPSPPPPPLVLRIWNHESRIPPAVGKTSADKSDTSSYHGGGEEDEIASLASLVLGVRLLPCEVSRMFYDDASPGTPMAAPPPPVPPRRGVTPRLQLPREAMSFDINAAAISRLASYPDLTPSQAVALARAARAYSNALWIAEAQADLSWLLLVSAVEAAARCEFTVNELRGRGGDATSPGSSGRSCDDDGQRDRGQGARGPGATKRFREFCMRYRPSAGPDPRPRWGAFVWHDENAVRDAVQKIWTHRCNAVHEGIPFPIPMCSAPGLTNDPANDEQARRHPMYEEVPSGLATHAAGARWQHCDTPLLLHAFAYFVRAALLKWWEAKLRDSREAAQAPPEPVNHPPPAAHNGGGGVAASE